MNSTDEAPAFIVLTFHRGIHTQGVHVGDKCHREKKSREGDGQGALSGKWGSLGTLHGERATSAKT